MTTLITRNEIFTTKKLLALNWLKCRKHFPMNISYNITKTEYHQEQLTEDRLPQSGWKTIEGRESDHFMIKQRIYDEKQFKNQTVQWQFFISNQT
ncbi:hypothetical protein [Chryseobacterium sp.]|uniref:hypothetical protein n=1 Tax=Chryseobacterium sp. TaxID=1871047 RepID=UPI0025C3CA68|nr:hypothetical protein [Chryseobacterium sp.]MBV8328014.1 hypothetical protein [Chryseobacterium sp.]